MDREAFCPNITSQEMFSEEEEEEKGIEIEISNWLTK
jgi:hypothetical protein